MAVVSLPCDFVGIFSCPLPKLIVVLCMISQAWKVIDKKLLVDVVIPKDFLQTKYESFTRQLSGWGFKRLHRTGPDYQCYYHEWYVHILFPWTINWFSLKALQTANRAISSLV
jgi:hypothetical protein